MESYSVNVLQLASFAQPNVNEIQPHICMLIPSDF